MSEKLTNTAIFEHIRQLYGQKDQEFNLPELRESMTSIGKTVPERTLRRWLTQWVEQGVLLRTGQKRSTRYQLVQTTGSDTKTQLGFLKNVEPAKRKVVIAQLRDLWTHSSTAIEGNTLSLGDTHSILELGLTISGKPLREHQEIVGHAKAIDILYELCAEEPNTPLTKQSIFDLHKAVQLEVVVDIYEPLGKWKVKQNYANSITSDGESVIIDYSVPEDVDPLMEQFIQIVNDYKTESIILNNAQETFAKLHLAFVHIHPFADGNGRLARLIANLPLLKAGLPPLLIDQDKRREYITLLADYQINTKAPTLASISTHSFWPDEQQIKPFADFCGDCYQSTVELMKRHNP